MFIQSIFNQLCPQEFPKELADSGLIKLEKKIEKNRFKLIASPLTIKDVNCDVTEYYLDRRAFLKKL